MCDSVAALQAPHGGRDARFSTTPFCAAVPGANGEPIVLDMATRQIAFGKARVAANQGVPVPDQSILDPDGHVTRDGAAMFRNPRGVLLPVGEHKGSGIAIMCELLAGALTGGRLEDTVTEEQRDLEVGGLFIAIGHTPNTKFLDGQIDLTPHGYIKTPSPWRTATAMVS